MLEERVLHLPTLVAFFLFISWSAIAISQKYSAVPRPHQVDGSWTIARAVAAEVAKK